MLSANDLTKTGLPREFLEAAAGSETFQAAVLALLEGQARGIQREAEGEELHNDGSMA